MKVGFEVPLIPSPLLSKQVSFGQRPSFPLHHRSRCKKNWTATAVNSKIGFTCKIEPVFPSPLFTLSAVSISVSGTGAKATNAAVMLCRACVKVVDNPTISHRNPRNPLFIVISLLATFQFSCLSVGFSSCPVSGFSASAPAKELPCSLKRNLSPFLSRQ